MKKIVITGGGTGGHVFPALAIAEEFKTRGYEVLYVGTSHGMEAKLVPEKGFRFYTVKTGAVKNQSLLKKIKTALSLLQGLLWALRFLHREKPVAVIGVGGYVSFPISLAAFILRYPLFLQEQNSSVGIANSFLGKLANKIFLGFEGATNYFSKSKCVVSGNPLRPQFFETRTEKYGQLGRNLVILGGSQGAQSLNLAILKIRERLFKKFPDLKILHQAGGRNVEEFKKLAGDEFAGKHEIFPFCEDMISLYEKASLVVARSGALTVTELIQVNRPAVLVPLPRRGQNDQEDNALFMQGLGGAVRVQQKEGFEEVLFQQIEALFESNKLQSMQSTLARSPHSNPARKIADTILLNL